MSVEKNGLPGVPQGGEVQPRVHMAKGIAVLRSAAWNGLEIIGQCQAGGYVAVFRCVAGGTLCIEGMQHEPRLRSGIDVRMGAQEALKQRRPAPWLAHNK